MAEFRMVRGLLPDDAPEWILEELAGETRAVVLASHMPFLPSLAQRLDAAVTSFPLNGLMAFERGEDGVWTERWRIAQERL
jgi:hypothetical protein